MPGPSFPKRLAVVLLGLFAAVLALGAAALLLLVSLDLRPLVERVATASLERRLTIGALRVGWNPLTIELSDLRLANASWGSEPDMVRIGHLSAEIVPWPLFRGVLRCRKLDLVEPSILLERDAAGTGNWRFGKRASPSSGGKNRAQFPTLLDLHVRDGRFRQRNSSGSFLRLDVHEGSIRSGGDDAPVTVTLDGAYQGEAGRLTAKTQPFSVLRNAAVPFGIAFSIDAAASTVDFKGTLTDPLNFDGAEGALAIDGGDLGRFLAMLDAQTAADFPFDIAGDLHRSGDHWRLSGVKGKLAASAFTGTLMLDEGGRGQADDVTVDVDFPRLDLAPLLAGGGKPAAKGPGDLGAVSLRLDPKRGTNIAASIKARQLEKGTLHLADVAAEGAIASSAVSVKQLAFTFASGRVDASATAHTAPAGTEITATAHVAGLDADELAPLLRAGAGTITGRVDGGLELETTGETLKDALDASRGSAVLVMTEGSVARSLLERASTNLAALFRKEKGAAPIRCLLGVAAVSGGVGAISPLRLRTSEGSFVGGGQLDLRQGRLDLTIKSDPASTGALALDIPFRISGSLAQPRVEPLIAASPTWLDPPPGTDPLRALPPDLRRLAQQCA
jgi:uncharacterized protein involved in outer membrane biogenesis